MKAAQWVVYLDTGRFGDWIVVTGPETKEEVVKTLTKSRRKKVDYIQKVYRKETS